MATKAETLAEQHRRAQLQIRAHVIRSFMLLWPLWNGDDASFERLIEATLPLIRVFKEGSAALAGRFYTAERAAVDLAGEPTVRLASSIDVKQITSSMYVTGQVSARNALASARTPTEARDSALTKVSGAVARHVLDGGRQTILDSVAADERALGWARVTDGDPCYFCLTLASRGAVYESETTAGFEAHDFCGCAAMPVFRPDVEIPGHAKWLGIYHEAQRAGVASGELQHGENSSAARLNAVRRYLTTNA